jgi:hypothetical protein
MTYQSVIDVVTDNEGMRILRDTELVRRYMSHTPIPYIRFRYGGVTNPVWYYHLHMNINTCEERCSFIETVKELKYYEFIEVGELEHDITIMRSYPSEYFLRMHANVSVDGVPVDGKK